MQQSQILCDQKTSISFGSNISRTTVLEMLVYGISTKPHGKESACNARDLGLIPGSGRSPREGNSNPFLPGESHGRRSPSMDWQDTVHGVTKSRT